VGRLDELRLRLAAAMEERGDWPSRSPWVREAIEAIPRDLFAPDRLWRWDGRAYLPLDRGDDLDRWAAELYGSQDDAAVTQVTDGLPTSSISCQAVVADMLDSLLLEPGQRVLETGTGCGWNAALMAWRVGPGLVTSVELDAELVRHARARLAAADAKVQVEVADGEAGWPAWAPFDRMISTYAVDRVPWAWVKQVRPGGRLVTPWGRLGHVALTVADDGRSATGWVQGLAQFMPARGGAPGRQFRDLRTEVPVESERMIGRDLGPLARDSHLLFALRVALPDVRITTAVDADGTSAWLHDGESSWAALSAVGNGKVVAYQGGPRRLADDVEQAWDRWAGLGCPEIYDFGMTVLEDHQYVWCEGAQWPAT
jgi:protein-L-isoaspartate(D-aspartate) O-methyltransferase